eukprot:11843190-Karenia_brevis.AAC.1
MAALKLITLHGFAPLCSSSDSGATGRNCRPFSQAEMAALKLITLSGCAPQCSSLSNGATHCHC